MGLSPHIDTHSAFEDCIFSLSLAGPCIMEFRRYTVSTWKSSTADAEKSGDSSCIKKALYLPPRSMLLLSGEARYAWNHYIPHHKVVFLLPQTTFGSLLRSHHDNCYCISLLMLTVVLCSNRLTRWRIKLLGGVPEGYLSQYGR